MPTKNQILLRFQKDLQELNAEFEAAIAKTEKARLKKFSSITESSGLVDQAQGKKTAAEAERKADRARATAEKDKTYAAASRKRQGAFSTAEKAWTKAEKEAERKRDDDKTVEDRRHEDRLEEIDKILPMYTQSASRAAESERHEKALSRINENFNTAWDRAREDYQAANQAALSDEHETSADANAAERDGFEAAEVEYQQTSSNTDSALHDALLKLEETRALEQDYQQQLRDTRQKWESQKDALRAQFKKDYDSTT